MNILQEEVINTETQEVRHLIHSEDSQIQRITGEVDARQHLLNSLIEAGLTIIEIENINSQNFIDQFLFQKHLVMNKAMAREYAAGKKQTHLVEAYSLPQSLEHLKGVMEAWLKYPSPGSDKFRHIRFLDGRYVIDDETLEHEFSSRKLKLFVGLKEVKEIEMLDLIIDYVTQHDMPLHQMLESSFWAKRFTRDSSLRCNRVEQKKLMIKRSYFNK